MYRWIAITATALAAALAVVVVLVSRDGNGIPIQQEDTTRTITTTPTVGEPDTQAIPTDAPPPEPIDSTDEIAGWKSYRSNEFGIVFQYPPSFEIVESKGRLRIDTEHTGQYGSQYIYVSLEFVDHGFPQKGLEGAAPLFLTSFSKQGATFKAVRIGKNNAIDAVQVIWSEDRSSFYVFRDEPKGGTSATSRTAFSVSVGSSLGQHRNFFMKEESFDIDELYRTQFDKIMQSLELLFLEIPISEGDLQSLKLPVALSISEQEALAVIKQRGFDTTISGISIKLKPANLSFFQAYTGPGSPIRIGGQYWEVRIPTPSDPECRSAQVLFVDATTGELYNSGISTSCF